MKMWKYIRFSNHLVAALMSIWRSQKKRRPLEKFHLHCIGIISELERTPSPWFFWLFSSWQLKVSCSHVRREQNCQCKCNSKLRSHAERKREESKIRMRSRSIFQDGGRQTCVAFSFSLPRFPRVKYKRKLKCKFIKWILFYFLRLNLRGGCSHVSLFPFVFIFIGVARMN